MQAADKAHIRIANVAFGAPAVDFYLNNKILVTNVPFGSYTDYIDLDSAQYTLDIRSTGAAADSAPISSKQITFSPGEWGHVLVLITVSQDKPVTTIAFFPADHSPTNGKARLDMINAAPSLPPLDVANGSASLAANLSLGTDTGAINLDQGTYNFQFYPTGGKAKDAVFVTNGTQLVGNVIYTLITLSGNGGQVGVLQLTSGTFMLRAVHTSPDTDAVDFYVDGQKLFGNLGYKNVTDYTPLADQIHTIDVRPAGAAPDSKPIVSVTKHIAAGIATTMYLVGMTSGRDKLGLQVVFMAPPSILPDGKAYGGVLQASPGSPNMDVLVANKVVFSNMAFAVNLTGYFTPGDFNISLVPSGRKDIVLLDLKGFKIEPGTIYTIVAINTPDKLSALLVTSKSYGEMVAPPAPATQASYKWQRRSLNRVGYDLPPR